MRPLAVFSFTIILSGCGYVGEPLYPATNIPNRIVDLAAVERGSNLEITFTIPILTTEGRAITTPGKIDLRVGLSPDGGFQANSWAGNARSVPVTSPEKPQPMDVTAPITDFVGKEVVLSVRMLGSKNRYSEWSNLVTVKIEPPLPTPADFERTSVSEGIRLQWTEAAQSTFRIFRKLGDEGNPVPLATADQPTYLDTTAVYGKTYTYFVQAIHDKAESEVAEGTPITPQDTFPPAVPSELAASAGVATVELAWERNTEPDLKNYRIFRSVGDGPFELLAEVDVPSYSDTKVQSGKTYRYRITAVDQTGNESQPSAEASATLP